MIIDKYSPVEIDMDPGIFTAALFWFNGAVTLQRISQRICQRVKKICQNAGIRPER